MKRIKIIISLIFILTLAFIFTGCNRTYRVKFDIYFGEETSQIVRGGETIDPFTPEREGYTFVGWLDDKDELFDVNTPINKNMTLTASWAPKEISITYKVSLDGVINEELTKDVKMYAGEVLKAPNDPVVTDYIFLGWFEDSKFLVSFDFNKLVYKDVTIFAKMVSSSTYTPSLIVSFNSTAAHVDIDDMLIHRLDKITNLPVVEAVGFDFLGWYYKDQLIDSDTVITMIEDFTLVAKWQDEVINEEHRIDFNTNGGDTLSFMLVNYGDNVTLPSPTKKYCQFLGWYYKGELVQNELEYNYHENITLKAAWKTGLVDLLVNGNTRTYRSTSTIVKTQRVYSERINEFRGVWVTSYVGDFSPSTNKDVMKANLTAVLDRLEKYHLNAMIFHVRTTNNAFYKTRLAPISSSYGTYESFEQWDYLTWLIDECHKRGIEFHAWLNPYRLSSNGYSDLTVNEIAAKWAGYPDNPASNPENILKTSAGGAILNPAKTAVQDYIVRVCEELANNYDIDAIHFDDYFYAEMSNNILTEEDQSDYEAYIKVHPEKGYSKSSASNKQDWRRDMVSEMIYKLHVMLTNYNSTHLDKPYVQLGISPTGIYKNGDGKVTYDNDGHAITNGSNTSGYAHYGSPLYADTLLWANNEWIDYLVPQTYWAFSLNIASFADLATWWSSVMKNIKCNLYLGNGIYMSFSSGNGSWYSDPDELVNQITYASQYDSINGFVFFSYKQIVYTEATDAPQYNALKKLNEEMWVDYAYTPKYR